MPTRGKENSPVPRRGMTRLCVSFKVNPSAPETPRKGPPFKDFVGKPSAIQMFSMRNCKNPRHSNISQVQFFFRVLGLTSEKKPKISEPRAPNVANERLPAEPELS